jgi:tetratricopeptide (TPR) repeat protein
MVRRALVALAILVASAPAIAQEAPAKADKGAKPAAAVDRHDPDNIRGISQYVEQLLKGVGKYLARDFNGALEVFRAAIPLAPKNPLGHYMIAEAQIANGNLPEADATIKQAEALTDDRNPGLRAKVLFVTADVKERLKRWDEAKAAWQTYLEYAQKHPNVAFDKSGSSRLQAIDDMLKQDKAYEAVRQRIAEEKKNPPTATPSPSATPPKK